MEPFIKIEEGKAASGATRIEPRMPDAFALKGTSASDEADDPRDLVARAEDALFSGEESDALRWYSRALTTGNEALPAWIGPIRLQMIRGERAEAQAWIIRASSMFPAAPQIMALRAESLAREGRIEQAVKAVEAIRDTAKAYEPDVTIQVALSRAVILMLSEDRAAEAVLKSVIELTPPADWRTPMWAGLLCDSAGRWTLSAECYRKAVERRKNLAYGWLRLAEAQRELGNTGAARDALTHAAIHCGGNERLHARIVRTSPGGIIDRIKGMFGRRQGSRSKS